MKKSYVTVINSFRFSFSQITSAGFCFFTRLAHLYKNNHYIYKLRAMLYLNLHYEHKHYATTILLDKILTFKEKKTEV